MKTKIFVALMVLMSLFSAAVFAADCPCDDETWSTACCGDIEDSEPVPVYTCEVEINGDWVEMDRTNRLTIERGDELDVKLRISSTGVAKDVQVDAFMSGIEHESVHDSTDVFDVKANRTYIKHMYLDLSDMMDADEYKLRVMISDRNGQAVVQNYNIEVAAPSHNVVIKDIVLDPSNEVVSGRGLLASVRVKNMGEKDEDGIKVTVTIPALNLEASDYVDELESGESTTSEDLYLRIPKCVEEGTYVVKAKVAYDDGYELSTKDTTITVLKDETCDFAQPDSDAETGKTVITVPGAQDVEAGAGGAVYPLMISNTGATAKTYTLSVSGVDAWGTYRMDPSNLVVVSARKTETVYLYVSANADAPAGEKIFMVSIASAGTTEQVPLTVKVMEGKEKAEDNPVAADWTSIKKGLEVGLVVLVVLLVILGLIVGFNKLKGSEDDDSEEVSGQTYY
ncbi:MAG: hypothetical protein KKF44_01445 [Nanoarchaeota archaeon]|nr:hypothetical protein [Nanoarchaeota archaeon]